MTRIQEANPMTSEKGSISGRWTLAGADRRLCAGIILALVMTVSAGCDVAGLFLDEGNIEKVANHLYRPGQKDLLSPSAEYKFIAEMSKKQVSEEEWAKMRKGTDNNTVSSVKVLGEKDSGGRKYAVVSVTDDLKNNDGRPLNNVRSRTWILENGKWRLLFLPKFREEVIKLFQAGDYSAAKTKAEEWLVADPFSVDAYKALGFGIERSDPRSFKRGDRSMEDIVRALIAINPEDTTVLFSAASWSENLSIAKMYLKKLEGTGSYSGAAYNVSLKIRGPEEKLKFFEGLEMTPGLTTQKLLALAEMKRWSDFTALAAGDGDAVKLQADLDGNDAAFAASLSARLGIAFHECGADATARKWLEYGITRDPNNRGLIFLAELLDSKGGDRKTSRPFRGSR